MDKVLAAQTVLHVSEDPSSSALLREQLAAHGLGFEVQRCADSASFHRAVAKGGFRLVVVDLPLPDDLAAEELAQVQTKHPEWPVLFRWGEGGTWTVEESSEQLARAVQRSLELDPVRPQTEEERRKVLAQLVRQQELLLRLAKLDASDLQSLLRDVTQSFARLLEVERVSVWEFDPTHTSLHCMDLFQRTGASHTAGQVLTGFPRYRSALESSLQIAAHDARSDPRTSEFLKEYLLPLGITSMLDAPIRCAGKVAGVLCLEHVGAPRLWTVHDQCAAAGAASLLARVFAERDRRTLEERLRQGEKMEAIGRLAAHVAHDFANRLTAIGSLTHHLQGSAELGGEERHTVELLGQEIEKAMKAVRELLAVGRATEANPSQLVSLDLGSTVSAMAPTLRSVLGQGVELELVAYDDELPVRIEPEALEQILLNLASNARDGMPGGGRCSIEVGRGLLVTEAGRAGTPAAALVVSDSGTGLTAEARRRLFEPFFSTKERGRGSGLGLTTVYDLVRSHQGEISVKSEVGKGTRFEILLPLGA
jgi:signal transduction histidine kinase